MNKKTLMTIAVASTFGLSAAAFAGSSHEVVTPFSVSDAGENIHTYRKGFSDNDPMTIAAVGSTSSEMSSSLSGSYGDGSASLSSGSAGAHSRDESLAAADQGIYSDLYVVSWAPVIVESWDLYVLDTSGMNDLAAADMPEIGLPTHELALVESNDGMSFELALVPTDELSSSEAIGD